MGAENLTKPALVKYIQYLAEKYFKRNEITTDNILKSIARIAFSKTEKTTDVLTALKMLGKYKKLFIDRLEVDTPNLIPIEQRSPEVAQNIEYMFSRRLEEGDKKLISLPQKT